MKQLQATDKDVSDTTLCVFGVHFKKWKTGGH